LLYIILWIIMPEAGREDLPADQRIQANAEDMAGRAQEFAQNVGQTVRTMPNRQSGILIGVALITFGVMFLLNNLNLFWWFRFDQWWPLLLIVGGLALLVSRVRRE
jgi:phage shock protein C